MTHQGKNHLIAISFFLGFFMLQANAYSSAILLLNADRVDEVEIETAGLDCVTMPVQQQPDGFFESILACPLDWGSAQSMTASPALAVLLPIANTPAFTPVQLAVKFGAAVGVIGYVLIYAPTESPAPMQGFGETAQIKANPGLPIGMEFLIQQLAKIPPFAPQSWLAENPAFQMAVFAIVESKWLRLPLMMNLLDRLGTDQSYSDAMSGLLIGSMDAFPENLESGRINSTLIFPLIHIFDTFVEGEPLDEKGQAVVAATLKKVTVKTQAAIEEYQRLKYGEQ